MFLSFLEGLPAARCITDLDFLHFLNELIPIIVSCIYFYFISLYKAVFLTALFGYTDGRTDMAAHRHSYIAFSFYFLKYLS